MHSFIVILIFIKDFNNKFDFDFLFLVYVGGFFIPLYDCEIENETKFMFEVLLLILIYLKTMHRKALKVTQL